MNTNSARIMLLGRERNRSLAGSSRGSVRRRPAGVEALGSSQHLLAERTRFGFRQREALTRDADLRIR
jgi:hypothetical protein